MRQPLRWVQSCSAHQMPPQGRPRANVLTAHIVGIVYPWCRNRVYIRGQRFKMGANVRLMRVGRAGNEVPAVSVGRNQYIPVSDVTSDFDEAFFAGDGLTRLRNRLPALREQIDPRPLEGVRIGPPIARPHQILCIGLNYRDHAAETGQSIPEEPLVFNKAPNTLVGPYDEVRMPRGARKLDWEVELGVVVARRCEYLADEAEAHAAIAGYVVVNDISERAFQLERGGQWVKGKSAATFNPCGPQLVTPDEVGNILDLAIWLDVDGVRRQSANTGDMIFSPSYLLWYLSQFMVLEPGDLINTGTPPGVALGLTPPAWLRLGQEMQLGIDGLGIQRQTVVSSADAANGLSASEARVAY